MSRRHAQILRREDALVLEDLGSAVGTYVNDQRITAHILSDGDRVRFGRQVQFEVVSEAIASLLESAGVDDRSTGAFVAFDADSTIRTFFKPNDGEAYFERQARRYSVGVYLVCVNTLGL